MSSRLILNICLKVVGVFYALNALNYLPGTISQLVLTWRALSQTPDKDPLNLMINYKLATVVSILIPIVLFVIALVLILKSESLARYLLPTDDSLKDILSTDSSHVILSICIKIFGFFSVISAIPYLSKFASRLWIMKENFKYYDNTGKIDLGSAGIAAALYIGVGLILIFHSDKIAQKLSPAPVSPDGQAYEDS
jgi:hypothetical protein